MKKGSKERKSKVSKSYQKEDFELNEVDYKILQLTLDYKELTDAKIAEIVGLSRMQVNKIKNKPAFRKVFLQYQMKAIDIILSAKTEAAIKMKRLIKSKDEHIAIKASENILGDDLKEKASDKVPIEVIIKYE
jgi:hypothetical protein